MTLTEAQEALSALETAINSGVLTTERSGRRITYQSLQQMTAQADKLRRDIQHAQGKPSVTIGVWDGAK